MGKSGLTGKQKAFIEAYLLCLNATEAALSAGYSENGVRQTAHNLLTNTYIKAEIDRRLAETHLSADGVIARLTEQAHSDASDFVTVDGDGSYKLDLAKAKERGKLHLVKSIKQTKWGLAIELYDAQAALVHLGRYHKLFTDNITVRTWKDDVIELIKAGKVTRETVEQDLGIDLATELFIKAGVNVNTG